MANFVELIQEYTIEGLRKDRPERSRLAEDMGAIGSMYYEVGEDIPFNQFYETAKAKIEAGEPRANVYAAMYEVLFFTIFGAFAAAASDVVEEMPDVIEAMERIANDCDFD